MVIEVSLLLLHAVGVLMRLLLRKSKLIRLAWWRLKFEWVWVYCWAKRTFVCLLLWKHGRRVLCVCRFLAFSCMIKPIQVTLVVCNNLVVAAAGSFDAGHIQ